jgi:acyl transferase domain-containing protein
MSENDVVISGMGGRFPLADNTDQLAKNLYEGTDMVTGDDTRWPIGTILLQKCDTKS